MWGLCGLQSHVLDSLRWHAPGWDAQLLLTVQYRSVWGCWALSSPCPHHLQESPAGELKLLIKLIKAAVGGVAAMFSGTAQAQHHAGALSVSEGSFSWMILLILPTWALSTWENMQESWTSRRLLCTKVAPFREQKILTRLYQLLESLHTIYQLLQIYLLRRNMFDTRLGIWYSCMLNRLHNKKFCLYYVRYKKL